MSNNKSFVESKLENQIQNHSLKAQELAIRLEDLDREVDTFLKEVNINLDKLTSFMENKENFTDENWTQLLQEKEKINEKLQRELANIRNPLKTKKAYSGLRVQNHWLHVR